MYDFYEICFARKDEINKVILKIMMHDLYVLQLYSVDEKSNILSVYFRILNKTRCDEFMELSDMNHML